MTGAPVDRAERQYREALERIRDFKQEPFDYTPEEWAKHTPETCAECKRWDEMRHPLQSRCEEWVRMFYRRKDRIASDERALHYKLRDIACAALALASEPSGEPEKHGLEPRQEGCWHDSQIRVALQDLKENQWDTIDLHYDAGEWGITLHEDGGRTVEVEPGESLLDRLKAAQNVPRVAPPSEPSGESQPDSATYDLKDWPATRKRMLEDIRRSEKLTGVDMSTCVGSPATPPSEPESRREQARTTDCPDCGATVSTSADGDGRLWHRCKACAKSWLCMHEAAHAAPKREEKP